MWPGHGRSGETSDRTGPPRSEAGTFVGQRGLPTASGAGQARLRSVAGLRRGPSRGFRRLVGRTPRSCPGTRRSVPQPLLVTSTRARHSCRKSVPAALPRWPFPCNALPCTASLGCATPGRRPPLSAPAAPGSGSIGETLTRSGDRQTSWVERHPLVAEQAAGKPYLNHPFTIRSPKPRKGANRRTSYIG